MQTQYTIEAKKDIKRFRAMIFFWWKTHRRDLPWRHTCDPYKILVSEIMLQQTQVSRGLPKYLEFISIFPTVQVLSKASPGDVLRVWKGMGYNRRALYLQSCAKQIVNEYNGVFPHNEQQLTSLPGVGTYTARAVLVFAYKKDIAMVDTNIRQIITHFFFKDMKQPEKIIQEAADRLVPKGKSWEWHQALMDYGALELVREKVGERKKKQIPFNETNRFFRGRVMDLMREKSYRENVLIITMVKKYKKDASFINTILQSLLKDGLISRSKTDIITLPK